MRTDAPSAIPARRATATTTAPRSRSWLEVEAFALACCMLSLQLGAGHALPLAAAAARRSHGSDGDGGNAVPSYMLDLYQRYVSGAPPLDGSNTVHCIHATYVRTRSGNGGALEFDMETIGGSEVLVRAELRLSRRARDAGGSAVIVERPLVLTMRAAQRRVDDQVAAAEAAFADDAEEEAEPYQPLWTATLASAPAISLRSRGNGGSGGGGWVSVGSWQTIDATQPIRRALSSAASKIEMLVTNSAAATAAVNETASVEPEDAGKSASDGKAKTAEAGRNGGGDSSGALELFVSRHGLPYLLVYTNDSVNLTADQISSRLRLRDADSIRQEADSLVDPETGLPGSGDSSSAADTSRRKRPAAVASVASSSSPSSSSSAAAESRRRIRKPIRLLPKRVSRRDVADDNEIPGDPDVARRLRLPLPQRSPLIGQQLPRLRPAAAAARTPASSLGDVLLLRSPERFRSSIARPQRAGRGQLIPWPEVSDQLPAFARRRQSSSKQGGDTGGSRGASSRRRTEQREQRQQKQTKKAPIVPAVSSASCGRKRLTLDFDDVGWGGWIIEPKSFDIHYCAGACEFPLSSAQQPTNHATIQSLLRAAGIRPDLPAPCCVPDRLSSVTLLYFDQRRNVVLKSYPGMTVESCACR